MQSTFAKAEIRPMKEELLIRYYDSVIPRYYTKDLHVYRQDASLLLLLFALFLLAKESFPDIVLTVPQLICLRFIVSLITLGRQQMSSLSKWNEAEVNSHP